MFLSYPIPYTPTDHPKFLDDDDDVGDDDGDDDDDDDGGDDGGDDSVQHTRV